LDNNESAEKKTQKRRAERVSCTSVCILCFYGETGPGEKDTKGKESQRRLLKLSFRYSRVEVGPKTLEKSWRKKLGGKAERGT